MANPQEISINTLPFWSRFTLTANLAFDGANNLNRVLTAGTQRLVFAYQKGQANVPALENGLATARDTLLVNANQTRGGGLYMIYGLSYTKDGWPYVLGDPTTQRINHQIFLPSSVAPPALLVPTVDDFRALDSFGAHMFLDHFRTQLNVDGTRRVIEMGPAQIYPGVGGASGGNIDVQNAGTFVANYMHIKEGMKWNPAGTVDSNISLVLECSYNVDVVAFRPPAAVAPEVATPLGREWTQGWIANFHGYEESPTSDII